MSPALYLQIAEDILRKIEEGTLSIGETIPGIQALRQQYKTSHVTVLRAFRELSEKGMIRKRPGMGYAVAPQANRMRKLRSLGCLFRAVSHLSLDQYYNGIMGTVQTECAEAGIGLYFSAAAAKNLINGSCKDPDAILADAEAMSRFADGFFADSWIPDDCIERIMAKTGKPLVVVNRSAARGITAVYPDIWEPLEKLYGLLQRLGYDSVICEDTGDGDYFNNLRVEIHDGEKRKNESPDVRFEILERINFISRDEILEKLLHMLSDTKKKHVFLAPADSVAWNQIRWLRTAGREVCRDYGIAGFFGLDAGALNPKLTTVAVDTEDLGRKAFSAMMNLLAGKDIRQADLLGAAELKFGKTV